MTDELQIARARKHSPGFAEYLEAKATTNPGRPIPRPEATAERVQCDYEQAGVQCIRAAEHTGPHNPPPPTRTLDDRLAQISAARRDPGLAAVRASLREAEQTQPEEVTT